MPIALCLLPTVGEPSPKPFKRSVGEIAQPDIAEDDLENPNRKNHIVGFIPLKPTIISKHIEYQKEEIIVFNKLEKNTVTMNIL